MNQFNTVEKIIMLIASIVILLFIMSKIGEFFGFIFDLVDKALV